MQCNSWWANRYKIQGVLIRLFLNVCVWFVFQQIYCRSFDLRTTLSVGMAANALVTCAFEILNIKYTQFLAVCLCVGYKQVDDQLDGQVLLPSWVCGSETCICRRVSY